MLHKLSSKPYFYALRKEAIFKNKDKWAVLKQPYKKKKKKMPTFRDKSQGIIWLVPRMGNILIQQEKKVFLPPAKAKP